MSKRLTNRQHLEYVASLPCLICRAGYYVGSNNIQAHHLLKPWNGKRGMSLRAGDDNVIPLCFRHLYCIQNMEVNLLSLNIMDYLQTMDRQKQRDCGKEHKMIQK